MEWIEKIKSISPNWITAIATVAIAIVAIFNFPPWARIQELETRRLALVNLNEQLQQASEEAKREKVLALNEVKKARTDAKNIREAAISESARLRKDIEDLEKEKTRLGRVFDLMDENLRLKERDIKFANAEIEKLDQARRITEGGFIRYVLRLMLVRTRGEALRLALVSSSKIYDTFRKNEKLGLSGKGWPYHVWLGTKDVSSKEIYFIPLIHDPFWAESPWTAAYSIKIPNTGRKLLETVRNSIEFQELPDMIKQKLIAHINKFTNKQKEIFTQSLILRIDLEDIRSLTKEPIGTTGDLMRDKKIAEELQRQEEIHRALAKSLEELENSLTMTLI